jgi:hypothetical protein
MRLVRRFVNVVVVDVARDRLFARLTYRVRR